MNEAEVISLINQWIITNGNNEITANVLRPILLEMVEQPNSLIGDLEQLATTDRTTLVNAINSVLSEFEDIDSNSVKISSGTENPNITPPDEYKVGDFYKQVDGLGNPLDLFQFDGFNWTSNDPQQDGFTTLGSYELNGNNVELGLGYQWVINGVVGSNTSAQTLTIDDAEDGESRVDIIVASGDSFSVIQGQPSEGQGRAVKPIAPVGTLELTSINIFGDQINQGVDPNDQPIYKKEQQIITDEAFFPISGLWSVYKVTESGTINQFNVPENAYNGWRFSIYNDSDGIVTLQQPLFNVSINLMPGEIAPFYWDSGVAYYESRDFISRSGTEGRPIVGDLEFEYQKGIYFSQNNGSESGFIGRGEDYYPVIQTKYAGNTGFFHFMESYLLIGSDSEEARGIIGNQYFDKQSDPNAFAQMQDLDNAVQSQTYDQTLGFGNTTDKTAIHENTSGRVEISPTVITYIRKIYGTGFSNTIKVGSSDAGNNLGWEFGYTNESGVYVKKGTITGTNNNGIALSSNNGTRLITIRDNSIGFGANNSTPSYANDFNTQVGFRGFAPISETPATNANQLARYDQVTLKANDADVLHKTGNETKTGGLTISRNDNGRYFFASNGINTDLSIGVTQSTDPNQMAYISSTVPNRALVVNAESGGNFGVGLFPTEKLDVLGNGKFSGLVILGSFTTGTEPTPTARAIYYNTSINKLKYSNGTSWFVLDWTLENRTITSTETLVLSDMPTRRKIYYCDATSGNITITLPTSSSLVGYEPEFIKTDSTANSVTIKANGSELINDMNTFTIATKHQKIRLTSNSTKLFIS